MPCTLKRYAPNLLLVWVPQPTYIYIYTCELAFIFIVKYGASVSNIFVHTAGGINFPFIFFSLRYYLHCRPLGSVILQICEAVPTEFLDRHSIYDWTALHILANNKDSTGTKSKLIGMLLEYRADPNVRKRNGATPLHSAAGSAHKSAIKVLINGGADVNVVNDHGTTPLDMAFRAGNYSRAPHWGGWPGR